MLIEVMREVKNFFSISEESGEYEIIDGTIELQDYYIKGQYIAVTGSILNDGIYQLSEDDNGVWTLTGAQDEEFYGTIYGLSIPKDFLELVKSIEVFQEKQGTPTNITSERFGVYSESRGTGADGVPLGWSAVFRKQLNRYRKMFPDINI